MSYVQVLGATSLLALLLTLALVREIRLRRAMQTLLVRLFLKWRNTHEILPDPRSEYSWRKGAFHMGWPS